MTVLTGFVLGTAVSITFGLAVVGFLFLVLASDYPQVRAEIRPLLVAAAVFFVLTITAGLSFIGLLRDYRWRWIAQLARWAAVAGTVLYFLP